MDKKDRIVEAFPDLLPIPWSYRDSGDKVIPPPGFVSDFVMATRGIETPTIFSIWTAFFVISTILKRDAWLKWFPKAFWPNIYVLLVAPPRECGKTTIIDIGDELLRAFHEYLPTANEQRLKALNLTHSKATPERIMEILSKGTIKQSLLNEDGSISARIEEVEQCSQLGLVVSEFSTFMGKAQYNAGLVSNLISLFDSRAVDDVNTIQRGSEVLKDIYVTLMSGSTPDGLKYSVPHEAFTDGFIDRLIVVYKGQSERIFSYPRHYDRTPTESDLLKRLAHVAHEKVGEFYMNDDCFEKYDKWYYNHKRGKTTFSKTYGTPRFDTQLLKMCLLMRAQRYEGGNEITIEDFDAAIGLLEETYRTSSKATALVGANERSEKLVIVHNYLERHEKVARRRLLLSMCKHNISSPELSAILDDLYDQGKIVIELDGRNRPRPSRNGKEQYIWIPEEIE